MICSACARAANRGLNGWENHKKAGCREGTWCDCAHKEVIKDDHGPGTEEIREGAS